MEYAQMVWDIAGWVLAPLCAGLAGALIATLKRIKVHDTAMEQGMRALLRQQLIDYHRDYVVSGGPCPIRIKEQATSVYQAYHALNGNGTGTKLWEEIMDAHVE